MCHKALHTMLCRQDQQNREKADTPYPKEQNSL